MELKKESKARILENFYALDYVLFGSPLNESEVCCPALAEEYISIKGALMSVLVEMYKLIRHRPKTIQESLNTKKLLKMAKKNAIIARENCKKLLVTEKGRDDVKRDLTESLKKMKKNVDVEKLVQEKIQYKSYSLAVDNLLIGRAITESKKFDKLDSWDGRIIEDAYKLLRDNLVESAMNIIENGFDE